MENINIKIKRISKDYNDIPIPEYATEGSAGMDIRAALKEPLIIKKGEVVMVPTNLSVEIPMGYEIQVRPRSGLAAKHGIGVLNSPGTVDSDYRGEIKIILINFGKDDFTIQKGDRIAQLIVSRVFRAAFSEESSLNESKRGSGGFGHTGKE
jgi:dUTP pyrophosphatase